MNNVITEEPKCFTKEIYIRPQNQSRLCLTELILTMHMIYGRDLLVLSLILFGNVIAHINIDCCHT